MLSVRDSVASSPSQPHDYHIMLSSRRCSASAWSSEVGYLVFDMLSRMLYQKTRTHLDQSSWWYSSIVLSRHETISTPSAVSIGVILPQRLASVELLSSPRLGNSFRIALAKFISTNCKHPTSMLVSQIDSCHAANDWPMQRLQCLAHSSSLSAKASDFVSVQESESSCHCFRPRGNMYSD